MKVEVVLAEGLIVGPEDRILIRLPEDTDDETMVESLLDHLVAMGLKDRALVMCGDMEFAKVETNA